MGSAPCGRAHRRPGSGGSAAAASRALARRGGKADEARRSPPRRRTGSAFSCHWPDPPHSATRASSSDRFDPSRRRGPRERLGDQAGARRAPAERVRAVGRFWKRAAKEDPPIATIPSPSRLRLAVRSRRRSGERDAARMRDERLRRVRGCRSSLLRHPFHDRLVCFDQFPIRVSWLRLSSPAGCAVCECLSRRECRQVRLPAGGRSRRLRSRRRPSRTRDSKR